MLRLACVIRFPSNLHSMYDDAYAITNCKSIRFNENSAKRSIRLSFHVPFHAICLGTKSTIPEPLLKKERNDGEPAVLRMKSNDVLNLR